MDTKPAFYQLFADSMPLSLLGTVVFDFAAMPINPSAVIWIRKVYDYEEAR